MVEPAENQSHPYNIRPATESDIPAILRILELTVQNPYGSGDIDVNEVRSELERITNALSNSHEGSTLVAEHPGETLGFAFFGTPEAKLAEFTKIDSLSATEVRLLYIDPDKRRNSVGSSLLRRVEEISRINGSQHIVLTTGPRYYLIGSGTFYEKQGYTYAGRISRYFNGIYPAKVYKKELS